MLFILARAPAEASSKTSFPLDAPAILILQLNCKVKKKKNEMAKRSDGIETRNRILGAAARLFSEKGFRQTSNADISRASGVNSALISYYFGDKETIYREAWRHSLRAALEKYPPDGGVPANAPVRKRLRGIIDAAVRRYSDPRCFDGGILSQEIASPTGLLEDVHEHTIFSLRENLLRVAGEYLGENVPLEDLRMSVYAIVAMCTSPQKKIQRIEKTKPFPYDAEKRVDHIFRFSAAGLNAVKKLSKKSV